MLYKIDRKNKDDLKGVKSKTLAQIGWKEKDLENLISKNLPRFIPENQLMIIFQERQRQEEADIFALDKEGVLYIFELKRWESKQENLLQVLRYGQKFGQFDYEALQEMLRKYKNNPVLELDESHKEYFKEVISQRIEREKFNSNQHFVVITNGVDLETLNAIQYWKKKGLRIDCLPYRVYEENGTVLLEFRSFNPQNEVLFEEETNIFIVNTNIAWSQENYKEMLQHNRAAAYGDRRFGIERIKNGDNILLYHSGIGIIAIGKAKGKVHKDEKNEEYWIDVDFSWKIDPYTENKRAVHASEINSKLSTNYSFRNTVFSINPELYDIIIEISKTK
ncbi:MAG: EVE domain-containing protein [Halobacteriota archaeon]